MKIKAILEMCSGDLPREITIDIPESEVRHLLAGEAPEAPPVEVGSV